MVRRIGIDLALKGPHVAVIVENGRAIQRPFSVSRDKAGFERLVRRATDGCDDEVEFVLEPTANAWQVPTAWLTHRGYRVIVTTGQKAADLRRVLSKHTKTDAVDGEVLARLPDLDPQASLPAPSVNSRRTSLARAVKHRAQLVRETTRHKLRIDSILDLANPNLGKALGASVLSEYGRAFLKRYLNPFRVVRLGVRRLETFLARHRCPKAQTVAQRLWTACQGVCELYAELNDCGALPFEYDELQEELNVQLKALSQTESLIAQRDETIRTLYAQIDPARTLQSIPGLGETIAPAVEALIGDISCFRSAKALVSFCGLCPREKRSGQSRSSGLGITKGGQRLLKQYLFLAAETARRCDLQFAHKYHELEARGKHHYVIVVALANMLVRRIDAVLRRRVQADGRKYELRDLNGQPILAAHARQRIAQDYPSQRERARRQQQANAATGREANNRDGSLAAGQPGQSEDSTIQQPRQPHPDGAHCTHIGTVLGSILEGLPAPASSQPVVENSHESRRKRPNKNH